MPLTRTLFYNFETPTALTYGRFFDQVNMRGFASTSGSSTTTTATESSGDGATPFDVVEVGDWLVQESDVGTQLFRRVTAKASSISLTVDAAWTLGAAGKAKDPSLPLWHRRNRWTLLHRHLKERHCKLESHYPRLYLSSVGGGSKDERSQLHLDYPP